MKTAFSPTVRHQPEFINVGLAAKTAPDAIRELHAGLDRLGAISDSEGFLRDLLARQELGSNCLDLEIALPHVRTTAVDRFVLAIGRSGTGIFFGEEYPSIRLVFLIGAPIDGVTEYLRWTAHLVRALRNPTFRETLLTAPSVEVLNSVWSLCTALSSNR